MSNITRRAVLRTVGVGAGAAGVAAVAGIGVSGLLDKHEHKSSTLAAPDRIVKARSSRIAAENTRIGSTAWRIGTNRTVTSTDSLMQIKGYTSTTSVHVGEEIDFHVSVNPNQPFTIEIYRLGWYGGKGARRVLTSPVLQGVRQPPPSLDPVLGTVTCQWKPSFKLRVPSGWTSGLHLGVITSAAGYRNYVPFVVRDSRPADILVVVPYATYQAYNLFPLNGREGKSLYYGYSPEALAPKAKPSIKAIAYPHRAYRVSFDRPFVGNGWPSRGDEDSSFAFWAESEGYDMTYATSLDLHSGRLDLGQYSGVVFSGHDEYWSMPMRDAVEAAVGRGTSLAFLSANNMYWHVRPDAPTSVGEARAMTCYKTTDDPSPDDSGPTTQFRLMAPNEAKAEQGLIGVQYNGIVQDESPLVVRQANHWMWTGTGLRERDEIPRLIGGEADGLVQGAPTPKKASQVLLSESPFMYRTTGKPEIQNTSVCEFGSGAIVFVAGTMNWTWALGKAMRIEPRVQLATANVFDRMLRSTNA